MWFFIWFVYLCLYLSPKKIQAKVIINEVLPYPEDGVEAIELIYAAEDSDVIEKEITAWTIWDRLGTIHTFDETAIKQDEFLVITFFNKLRNSGDSVILKDEQGFTVDEFHYENSQKGLSYSRVSNSQDLFVLSAPSIGKENVIPSPTMTPLPENNSDNIEEEAAALISEKQEESHNLFSDNEAQTTQRADLSGKDSQPSALSGNDEGSNFLEIEMSDEYRNLLVDQIKQVKNDLELKKKKRGYHNQLLADSDFITTVKFEATTVSSEGILSVIIGGLLFFIASKLVYE